MSESAQPLEQLLLLGQYLLIRTSGSENKPAHSAGRLEARIGDRVSDSFPAYPYY